MAKKLIDTTVENDIKKIDDIKDEVIKYAKERIDIEVQNSFKKVEKKIVKAKNGKIFRRDILIILLLCLSGFLGYKLYKTGYFNDYIYLEKIIEKEKEPVNKDEDNKEQNIEEDKKEPEKDLSFHKVALDNIYISSKSEYLKEFYDGNMTNELLLSLAINKLDKDKIINDEDSFILKNEDLKNIFEELFEGKEYEPKSFKYDDITLKYLKSQEIYVLSDEIEIKESSNIKRYITNIDESDDKVIISTIEGIVTNNNVVNILNKTVVGKYKNDDSLKDYEEKLNKLEYTFKYENNTYKLVDIKNIK